MDALLKFCGLIFILLVIAGIVKSQSDTESVPLPETPPGVELEEYPVAK